MNFRPIQDRVLIKRIDEPTKAPGGIIIPGNQKEKGSEGRVVAVGPGTHSPAGSLIPMNVKAGDRVIYGKYAGQEVQEDGETYLVMKESDILARINEAVLASKA